MVQVHLQITHRPARKTCTSPKCVFETHPKMSLREGKPGQTSPFLTASYTLQILVSYLQYLVNRNVHIVSQLGCVDSHLWEDDSVLIRNVKFSAAQFCVCDVQPLELYNKLRCPALLTFPSPCNNRTAVSSAQRESRPWGLLSSSALRHTVRTICRWKYRPWQ